MFTMASSLTYEQGNFNLLSILIKQEKVVVRCYLFNRAPKKLTLSLALSLSIYLSLFSVLRSDC